MYTRLLNIWTSFRSSFWFVPSLLLVVVTCAAFGLIHFDKIYGQVMVTAFPMFEMSPPAARSILSSIVGAMVSTTGVVFSITIVALSLASSQFGSRLIRTYRNRKTTHFTLGIFVSTSLFCILVLSSIREVDDYRFVPTTSVVVGILLTVVCLGTLVYYIHDMSMAIQAPNVIQHSADDLDLAIDRLFPESFGERGPGEECQDSDNPLHATLKDRVNRPCFSFKSSQVGYLQAIENETLMKVANDENIIIRLLIRPGDFLGRDREVVEVWRIARSADDDLNRLKETVCSAIENCLIVGAARTHIQDIRHAFDELVDIAVRALSPGVNDPFTAVNCVDRIHSALVVLQDRKIPSAYRFNDEGELRIIAQPVGVDECIEGSLGMIENYASKDPLVADRIKAVKQVLEARRS